MDHSVHESLSHQKEQKNISFSTVPNKKFENQKLENVLGWELWRYTSLLMSTKYKTIQPLKSKLFCYQSENSIKYKMHQNWKMLQLLKSLTTV